MDKTYDRLDQIVIPRPNWGATVKEVLEYKTEIFTAEDGSETRLSKRTKPRITASYRADTVGEAANAMFNDLVTDHSDRVFMVPMRYRSFALYAAAVTPTTTIQGTGTAPWWLQEDVPLCIESTTTQEAVAVSSVVQDSSFFTITLTQAISGTFAAGDRVMMGLWSHYEAENSLTSLIRSHRQLTSDYLADPARLPLLQPGTTPNGSYKSYEVVPPVHDWTKSLAQTINDRQEVVDFGRGIIDRVWDHRHREMTENRRYVGLNADKTAELVQLFMRHRGMRVPFWTPWMSNDFPAIRVLPSSGGSNIHFTGDEYSAPFEDDPVLNYVWVKYDDGDIQINGIASNYQSVGNDYTIMEDPWEQDFTETTEVRWALLARFATDRLELDWQTADVAVAQLPIRALRTDWADEEEV